MTVAGSVRNKVRVRVNGLLVEEDSLLMVQLLSPVAGELIWMPPGGGLRFGESLTDALRREIREETGIETDPGPLWYMHEVITDDIHAIEFYFLCRRLGGVMRKGSDPEYSPNDQIIRDVAFLRFEDLVRSDIHPAYLRTGFLGDYGDESGSGLPKFI